jgi:phage terminase small subunit
VKKLPPRQRLFIHEYLIDLNGTQAAIRAGYSKRTARITAAQLLAKPNIKKAVEVAIEKKISDLVMSREEILKELSLIGRSDLKNYFYINEAGEIQAKMFDEMPEGASRALESIEENRVIRESADGSESNIVNDKIKFKGHDKIRALELLGRNQGMFPTKIEGGLEVRAKLSLIDFKKSLKGCQDASGS